MSEQSLEEKLIEDSRDELRDLLRGEWEALDDKARELIGAVLADRASAALRGAVGEEIDAEEQAHLKAQASNLKAVAGLRVASLVDKALERGAKLVGEALGVALKRVAL